MIKDLEKEALHYHESPMPGKIGTQITKKTDNQRDLALAYTPGVAAPVRKIASKAEEVYRYTAKGNLVGVITNGTAVLGLGDVGPLAAKPVMEGKAVLFKRYANVDCFDIEVAADDPESFINTVARIAPTFGGINLEDIKAPQCFEIENSLIERLDIPVFHDDQHGTAIIVAAGLLNALHLQGKKLSEITMVCLGAGAAGIASMRLLVSMGLRKDNIFMVDRQGIIHTGRKDLNPYKFAFAIETSKRTLKEAMQGADVFLGVSGANLINKDMLKSMAIKPIIFALSNPDPEIHPETAKQVRDDLIIATGRSDFANQVNNVLSFPYVFRGALDIRASTINQEMLIAAVETIKDLAREPIPVRLLESYTSAAKDLAFGPDYIIPKPNDPRLIERLPAAIAKAAIATKVARLGYPAHYPK